MRVEEGIDEDVREQVAELIGDDIVFFGGCELDHGFLSGFCDDHSDIFFDDKYLISVFDDFVGVSEYFFSE